jgi:lysozyme
MTLKPSKQCYELIMHFEGLRLEAYYDSVNVVTIGIGTTRYEDGSKVKITDRITKERALQLLEHDITKFAQAVNRLVKVNIHQHHFDALVSFVYNVGIGNLENSTLLKKLNKGDFTGAAAEFPKWNKAGGKVLAGLTRRREAEKVLFEIGVLDIK